MSNLWATAQLTEEQHAALAKVRALPDDKERPGQSSGEPVKRLMAEHGIVVHPTHPYDMGFDVGAHHEQTTHVDESTELHTGQTHLWKPALEHYIKHPDTLHSQQDASDLDDEGNPYHEDHPEVFHHQDKMWIGEGHHRLLAGRMMGYGLHSHYRDVDGENEHGYADDVDYDKPDGGVS